MVDIVTNQECNNSCVMCTTLRKQDNEKVNYQSPSKKELIKKIDSLNNPQYIAFTGGEPTLRADLFEILEYTVKRFPKTEIALLTNGRMMAYPNYTKRLVATGVRKFIIPIHAHHKDLHDFISRSDGSFEQTLKGIKNLSKHDVDIEIRVIIHAINYVFLPQIAELIKNGFDSVSRIVLLYFDAIGSGFLNRKRLFVPMTKVVPYLQEAVDFLEGYNVRLYHFPLCVLDKKYHEKAKGVTVVSRRITFKKECDKCKLKNECPGIWQTYAKLVGVEEFEFVR